MIDSRCVLISRWMVLLGMLLSAESIFAQRPTFNAALRARIDRFVESERQASGIPSVALAIVDAQGALHVHGYGHDGRGAAIDGNTPFPLGSLTKSFTALLVRQAIDAGQLDADAPVQRYLPWFRVADAQASAQITLRHLLNQTSGFSRADGIAPLLHRSDADIETLTRGFAAVSLNRAVGERYEYSNLNFVLLGAVLQSVTGRAWHTLVRERIFQPLAMTHSYTDYDSARRGGMTATHRMWFGMPVAQALELTPGLAPTGSVVASADDMGRYLQMFLAGGTAPGGRVASTEAVAQLLAPASPPWRARLLSSDFRFRYGEGWFIGPFGAAADARWHLGNLPGFAAWMVVMPESKQAVVVLINANSELPLNDVNAVMSRLPIGVVNLLRGQPVPQGLSLRSAYRPLNSAAVLLLIVLAMVARCAARARSAAWSAAMAIAAIALAAGLPLLGLGLATLSRFAPDLALVLAAACALLCLPATLRLWRRVSRIGLRGASAAPL
jgi:CubicO group peptidase (beta-lactamase class C family)